MKIIGLTGSIGTGKSSASEILNKEFDIPIIDADKISREAVEKGSRGLSKIENEFGKEFITENGELNRIKMGALVFSDEKARFKLNDIVHPEVTNRFNELVNKYRNEEEPYVIYDCPLLIEEKLTGFVDVVMLIYTSFDIQLSRVMLRDKISKEDAVKRIEAQMSPEEKIKYADIVVDNNGNYSDLKENIKKVYQGKFSKNNTCINIH
ncbi:dephospho-CoA kinase [Anaerofustis stercorihominis]|uniref:dephospho-CoA kinase n=1 Tax=Anaerofustis stercorihominis TaxID=214853 RepID=UPI00214C02B9|nr:dephospho-CoA kinase [Anaerofustis stercorihominis]MCR2033811.1 dephospho-CoA kinase [Anaerofustis stercorihominis]